MQNGYRLLRRDRNFTAVNKTKGGGIIVYLRQDILYTEPNLEVPEQLEVCWCILQPTKPNSIILAAVYLPPDACASTRQLLIDHLVTSSDFLRSSRPKAKTILIGDFNSVFDESSLSRQLGLRQIVGLPTRGSAILDKIFTDINSCSQPDILAPLGTADHNTVLWSTSGSLEPSRQTRSVRPLTDSSIREFGRWICSQNWEDIFDIADIDVAAEKLQKKLRDAYEEHFPETSYRCKTNEPPWMTKRLKDLIRKRNRAHSRQQWQKLQRLRDEVCQEIRSAKEHWYKRRVANIIGDDKKSWYGQVRAMTSSKPTQWNFQPTTDGTEDTAAVAELTNNFFADICNTYEPLRAELLPAFLPAESVPFEIQPWQVAYKLSHLRQSLSVPDEDIPVRLMKEFSIELAVPLAHIYNKSLKEGKIPIIWKQATIIPLPKKPIPESPGDLRPISLTPTFSKILEQFVVPLMTADIRSQIDKRQYGNVKGASTSHYLIRLLHSLLTELNKPDKLFSTVMYDFKKGFDLIDHTILMKKIIAMGLRSSYAIWLAAFLQNRRQRVRMPDGKMSNWTTISCGIPQGTLVGPLAFLAMINDAVHDEQDRLKYVDDLTIYESCPINTIQESSHLQRITDNLCDWAEENKMVLNAQKCQVMHFFTAKKPVVLPDTMIHGKSLPIVTETKLLGITISSDLSWQPHVDNIVKKASRALYMLHIMKKYRPPLTQMVQIYTTYIRPLIEYCTPVFHAGLTARQASQIEKVQKRALKLIGGFDKSYQQLLNEMKLDSLADRREQLCFRLAKQMLGSSNHRDLFPPERRLVSGKTTRRANTLQHFCCNARLRKSSIPHMTSLINADIMMSE